MRVSEAVRALKQDRIRAFFYWLTFVLTTMFVFLFLNIAMSKQIGVTFLNAPNSDIPTNLALILIVICIVEILFANDFYVRSKSKDLAIRLVCGATYFHLASYLLLQTFILLASAIPCGILTSLALIPVFNLVAGNITQDTGFVIAVSSRAVLVTALILFAVIFWATFMNLGFAYRSSTAEMMNAESIKRNETPIFPLRIGANGSRMGKIINIVLTLLPIVLFFQNPGSIMLSAAIGIIGISGLLSRVIIPFLSEYIDDRKTDDHRLVCSLGFLRTDIRIMKANILLLVITAIFLVSILVTATNIRDILLILLSYIVMNIMLSLAILFRYSSELQGRGTNFRTLSHLGYMPEDLKKSTGEEVNGLYGVIAFLLFLYIFSICLSLLTHQMLSLQQAILLNVFCLVPLLICDRITLRFYRSIVLKPENIITAPGREEE